MSYQLKLIDVYMRKRQLLLASQTSVRIYCDASFKDDIMTAAIVVMEPTRAFEKTKVVLSNRIIDGEMEAVRMAVDYIKENPFLQDVIICTEMLDFIFAFQYCVISQCKIKNIPNEYRSLAHKYRDVLYLLRRMIGYNIISPKILIVFDKADRRHNPAHAVANRARCIIEKKGKDVDCNVKALINDGIGHQRNKGVVKKGFTKIGKLFLKWGEGVTLNNKKEV